MRMLLIGVVLGVMTSVGFAGDTNAALGYYRAWVMMDRDLSLTLITGGEKLELTEDGAAKLGAGQETVEGLIEASRGGEADWDIAYEDGPLTLLPHLGKMQNGSKILAADALRCASEGDHAGAAARVAAIYHMAGHVSQDRVLISSLVGMAIGNMGNKLADQFLDEGVFDGDDAAVVLAAMRELDSDDRFGMREAIVGEWRMIGEFLVSRAPEKDAGKWLVETMQLHDDDAETEKIAAMDKEALMRELGGWSAYYGDMLGAWDAGDRARMDAEVGRLKDGKYGTLTLVMAASLTRAFDSAQRSKADFTALMGRLEGIGG